LTGLTAPLIGFPPLGLITDDTPDHHLISCRLTERTPLALVHKDGTQKWVEYKTSLISWEEKPAIIFYGKDITNQKKMEESLKNSIKQLRTIANSMEESFGGTSGAAETLPHSLTKNNPSKEKAKVKKLGRGSDHPPKVPADVIV
jgi:PAS domain-containing protein